jgi:damage-control phosphatase, subfamily III
VTQIAADGNRPLQDDGYPDIVGYNKELAERKDVTWLSCPWLFSECYLYRY